MKHSLTPGDDQSACDSPCKEKDWGRRDFLFASGFTLLSVTLPGLAQAQARVAQYPRKKIGLWSRIKTGEPLEFHYPWDHANCRSVLMKLGRKAAGGVGPDKDLVAFNGLCPHMGWSMPAQKFHSDPGIAGPCAGHWTTFDLTRHGMVISGHATQGLPQVMLELQGDDIFAVGMLGLVFGFYDNKIEPKV